MRLFVDQRPYRYTVSKPPAPKTDQDGRQRADRNTGELLYTVQLFALDESGSGGDVITVTVAGELPKVTLGQAVTPVELEAIPWAQNGRNGVAYRAKAITAVTQAQAKAA